MTDDAITSTVASRFAITPERRAALLIACGAGVGIAQTVVLKRYVDSTSPTWFPQVTQLGNFGKPSALIGVVGGTLALLVGLYFPLDAQLKNIAVAYGGSSIAGGLLSGIGVIQ